MEFFDTEARSKIQAVVDLFQAKFPFNINGKSLETLIFQGGMGVDFSGPELARAVAETGSAGTISTSLTIYEKEYSELNLSEQDGIIGTNNLVSLVRYEPMYELGKKIGADFIASGAGITGKVLRRIAGQIKYHTQNHHFWTVPMSSNIEQLKGLVKRNIGYGIIENVDAGGHNGEGEGFEETLESYRTNPVPFGENKIVFAGGIRTGEDIARVLDHGFHAVQIGSAFLGASEARAPNEYRDLVVHAKPGDVGRVVSPTGLSATGFLREGIMETVLEGKVHRKKPCQYNADAGCLKNCRLIERSAEVGNIDAEVGDYCIEDALRVVNPESKVVDYEPLYFCGLHPEKMGLRSWIREGSSLPAKEIIGRFLVSVYESIIEGSYKTKGYQGKISDHLRKYAEQRYKKYTIEPLFNAKILQL